MGTLNILALALTTLVAAPMPEDPVWEPPSWDANLPADAVADVPLDGVLIVQATAINGWIDPAEYVTFEVTDPSGELVSGFVEADQERGYLAFRADEAFEPETSYLVDVTLTTPDDPDYGVTSAFTVTTGTSQATPVEAAVLGAPAIIGGACGPDLIVPVDRTGDPLMSPYVFVTYGLAGPTPDVRGHVGPWSAPQEATIRLAETDEPLCVTALALDVITGSTATSELCFTPTELAELAPFTLGDCGPDFADLHGGCSPSPGGPGRLPWILVLGILAITAARERRPVSF